MGGGGFVGSHLSEGLLAAGHKVNVFDQPRAYHLEYLQEKGATIYIGDFLTSENVSQAMLDCDVVFHLISTTVPKTSNDDPLYDIETNILGTLRILDEARKAQVKKIVFSSSGGTVYGIPQEIPIKESHPTDPISSYGIHKLTIEKYLQLYWTLYGLNYCILRVANAYGERQPTTGSQGAISSFLNKALNHDELIIWGDGSVMRDYIYVDDIINALVKGAKYEGEPRVFNIGGGQGHSLNDIIDVIEQIVGGHLRTKYLPGRIFDVPVNVLDVSLAKAYLNWQPKTGLLEGISRTYEYMLKQREEQ